MAENTLNHLRRTPASHLADEMAQAEVTGDRGVALFELSFPVQMVIRAQPGSPSATAVEQALGVALPTAHGQVTGDPHGAHIIWLSPDEFSYVDVSREQSPGADAEAAASLEGLPGQVIDVSANRAVLELTGPSARAVLEKGCAVDLHDSGCPTGTGVSTQIGTVPVVLHRVDAERFRIYPRASFTDYLVRWLIDGMLEFNYQEVGEELL
ncbi:sarcosine oxidase subunit gamma [Citricoccus sp. NR2]|uniref:sarcosine oxidase subunit gamma n=1 Tax=Citricoccus sp. NR2 TaxID=3004095 RepID=UPI0022DDE3CE|nr:sarcosine oxidase subunit gamma family protein [Citricoccus sp. NR2]WBL18970.1 sarcosine oxidase subunit gamma [Citricoccus sp. NR2]